MMARPRVLAAFAVAALLAGSLVSPVPASAAVAPSIVLYAPPVLAPVVDPFRPPAHIGGSGNRGLEYGNTEGTIVAASASGSVVFAGPVAGRRVITIAHRDGLETTYTGLLEIFVAEGQWVNQHSAIAVAGPRFHFGALVGSHYLDPQILLDASLVPARPRLVPPPS